MNESQKLHYRARMSVAQLFRSFLSEGEERPRLMARLGVERMPVIVPALGDTLASHIREAAKRHFENNEQHVVVPVCLKGETKDTLKLSILTVSTQAAKTFWQLEMGELHDNVTMAEVVDALDSSKKWDIKELDSTEQELGGLAPLG